MIKLIIILLLIGIFYLFLGLDEYDTALCYGCYQTQCWESSDCGPKCFCSKIQGPYEPGACFLGSY